MAQIPTIEEVARPAVQPSGGPRQRPRRLLRQPSSIFAWGTVALVLLLAAAAPLLAPYDPLQRSTTRLAPPFSPGHLLGTDGFGRDQLSRLLWGARPLVVTALCAVMLALLVGLVIGMVAGYRGGWTETVLMRAMDAILSFPLILFAIMIVAALGASLRNLIIAIAVSQVPIFARLVRALAAQEASREYVLAAKAAGHRTRRILTREILPNLLGPVAVQATSIVAVATGYAAALSYLGLGIQPPTADWGYMVKETQEFVFFAPDLALVPGVAITLFVLAWNFLGDDLRDIIDPDRGL